MRIKRFGRSDLSVVTPASPIGSIVATPIAPEVLGSGPAWHIGKVLAIRLEPSNRTFREHEVKYLIEGLTEWKHGSDVYDIQ